ncbi:MAG TPA: trypsin-like peptidase domain-containing protein [Niabella sp.]|nr:trypsin-like peptidase domain-containing protein [Niabella sp.]HOZ97707.1 trypsin-like peptidase domain-containing protein [Niabella sp.]HQW14013.1 trypsin-like peptidase domain-containing protein [Niabella sp.]HQX19444.1 trypsin-like peptidase domain-containing protein [Niabella sp.]HQX40203.1 trypsin-like peptidase domain-containing protein [Niabella sp.]
MSSKLYSFLFILTCFVFQFSIAQNGTTGETIARSNIAALTENKLKTAIQKVYPASVYITTHEILGGSTTGMSACGVCVSKDGIIMTAGHMTIPNGKYEILFPDGRKVPALGLGMIGKLDAGLLKITKEDVYPFAEMGNSSSLVNGELCFSLSHPGSFRDKKVARVGYITSVNNDLQGDVRTNHILSSCVMEPGDSGGPLFDVEGKVIGTRSYIGLSVDENYDVPVDVFKTFWNSLMNPESYARIPVADSIIGFNNSNNENEILKSELESSIQEYEKELGRFCVEILSEGKPVLGTLVNPKGITTASKFSNSTFIITKASELGNKIKARIDGKLLEAKMIYQDDSLDLALLSIQKKMRHSVSPKDINTDSLSLQQPGKIIISAMPNGKGLYNLVGTTPFQLSAFYYVGYLGLKLEKQENQNIIATIQPNSAAEKSGLKSGELLTAINGSIIENPQDFIGELKNKKPGEVISIVRTNKSIKDTLHIKLGQRPFTGNNHISEKFSAGRSERRDGFEQVFIQNIDLKPSECGSPVFDLNKKLVAINIARYSRVGTLAIPGNKVLEFLKAAIAQP